MLKKGTSLRCVWERCREQSSTLQWVLRGDLKQEFIHKIKGMAKSTDTARVQASDTAASCKLWDQSDPNFHDDIGFAYMSVPAASK